MDTPYNRQPLYNGHHMSPTIHSEPPDALGVWICKVIWSWVLSTWCMHNQLKLWALGFMRIRINEIWAGKDPLYNCVYRYIELSIKNASFIEDTYGGARVVNGMPYWRGSPVWVSPCQLPVPVPPCCTAPWISRDSPVSVPPSPLLGCCGRLATQSSWRLPPSHAGRERERERERFIIHYHIVLY